MKTSIEVKNLTKRYGEVVALDNQSITVGYWPFEGNGNEAKNATDYSGYDNNGTVFGATWSRTGGKIGGAYSFDQSNNEYIHPGL